MYSPISPACQEVAAGGDDDPVDPLELLVAEIEPVEPGAALVLQQGGPGPCW
jgi:hypothetical protein